MPKCGSFHKNLVFPMSFPRRRATDCKSQRINHQETSREKVPQSDAPRQENPSQASDDLLHFACFQALETGRRRFQKSFNLYLSNEPPDSHTVVVERPVVEPKERTRDEIRVSSEEESTDLPSVANRSKRPNTSKQLAGKMFFTHFRKDPTCEVCKITKTTRALSKSRPEARGDRTRHPRMFSDAITADHGVLRTTLVCSIVTQLWCKTTILIGSKATQRSTQLRTRR